MQVKCLVCGKLFDTEKGLHHHLKTHQLLLAEYYQKYHPRYDKYDGSIIKFRNKAQYFDTDFNSRDNLKLWVNSTDKPTVRAYCRALLEHRKDKKGLIWAPTQIELRTTMVPPIQTYDALFGDYYALCEELGLKTRFQQGGVFATLSPIPLYTIYVDTREQKPFDFPLHPTERRALKFGDYACSESAWTQNLVIERKSPQDFCGTLSGGLDRFRRELDRAKEAGAYVVILVEDTLNRMLRFNYQPYVYHKNVRINPEYIFFNVRDIIQDYGNVQFLFVEDRLTAQGMVTKLFDSRGSYKNVDLQLFYDLGKL